jgi:hypothetical protein
MLGPVGTGVDDVEEAEVDTEADTVEEIDTELDDDELGFVALVSLYNEIRTSPPQ